jgi:FtsP/CotA-like multicopper oxidase with cupredoxin domain
MKSKMMSRRDFLKSASFSAAFMLGGGLNSLGGGASSLFNSTFLRYRHQMGEFMPDAEVNITAAEKFVQILPGAQTKVWSYAGQLVSGSGATVQNLPGIYLGPILRVKSGTKLRIRLINHLAEDTVLHPHGLRVPEDCDGQPMQAIGPDMEKIYDFQVIDRACPAWFHPHPMGRTAEQVMMGLAGLFTVWDDQEASVVPGADTGANDVPVIIQDRNFDSSNQFLYNPNQMWGYLGSKILVNGQLNQSFNLEPRGYRLRFLNGSNARTYKLNWSNNMPFKVIGTDGGLLPAAVQRSYIMLMPGERVDVWADFSSLAGKSITLRSLSFNPGGMMGGGGMTPAPAPGAGVGGGMTQSGGMDSGSMDGGGCMNCGGGGGGGGGMGGTSLANGAAFTILTVNVSNTAATKPVLGSLPSYQMPFNRKNVSNFSSPVPFTLAMQRMVWTINGRVYNMEDMTEVADDEMVTMGVPIAWEWINASPIPHPMHIHSVQFQVIQRTPPSSTSAYTTVNQGFIDSGWKDTVSVWPGERVKIAMKFEPYSGMYMYHCHILEHEDMTMMRNLMVMDPTMPM